MLLLAHESDPLYYISRVYREGFFQDRSQS